MHIMLDLETMGNTSNAPIIAIGAVMFDADGVTDKFYRQISLDSSVNFGCSMDVSTVLWWLKQSDDARAAFKDNDKADDLHIVLDAFTNWVNLTDADYVKVWGNGVAFDNVILTNAYQKLKRPTPWKFWNDKCYRTVKGAYPDVQMVRTGTHHNALDDAESQALHLIEIDKVAGGRLLK